MSTTILTEVQIQCIGLEMPSMPLKGSLVEFARAIEQAVLRSEQVQAWKRDAERYRWLQDRYKDVPGMIDSGAIDAAMEKKP